jgi:hypothetical protein
MAQNVLAKSVAELLDLGAHCKQGLVTNGVSLGILQYTPANYGPRVDALAAKQLAFNAARTAYAAAFGPVHAQQALLRKACLDARKILSISLGDDWSTAWVEPGWPNHTTEVPEELASLKTLGTSLQEFLGVHGDFEVATGKITFTGERYGDLLAALVGPEQALSAKKTALGTARDDRKADDKALRVDTRGLIALLEGKLDPNSAIWDAFGLNRPGASQTPGAPLVPTLQKVTGGAVLAQVAPVTGATYYRWFAQLVGVDPEFRFLGRTHDALKETDDQPATGTLKVKVEAANEAGPGKASPVATIVLG